MPEWNFHHFEQADMRDERCLFYVSGLHRELMVFHRKIERRKHNVISERVERFVKAR